MVTNLSALELEQTYRAEPLPASSVAGDASLVYIYPTGPLMGTRYVLDADLAVIGRTEDCKVRNTDGSVSRYHARIDRRDGGYAVTDLGSTNGTFVNNVLHAQSRLTDGDYLRIGNCIYRFLAGGNFEAEYHEEIYRLTVIDGLTGLANRRGLAEFLARELVRSQRHRRPLALALLDIDRFKQINDRFGHLAGDTILQQLAALAVAEVGQDELFARYGGEEFALVLPEAAVDDAVARCDALRRAVAAHPFALGGQRVAVTISAGVVSTDGNPDATPASLLAAADKAMYRAKSAGRNQVAR